MPGHAESARFCCAGCEAVHNLLQQQGLTRFYALGGADGSKAMVAESTRSHSWLEQLVVHAEAQPGDVATLNLDVQGIHCAACVWLMNESFKRHPGTGDIVVNPTVGTVRVFWKKSQFDLRIWVKQIEQFGYQFGPARKVGSKKSVELPLRLGICAAIAINVMLFSVSFYFGLSRTDSEVFQLFTGLSFLLSTVTVVVGGWPFFSTAWFGIRSGLLHLDVPIALGILLVYIMSCVQLFSSGGRGDLAYFDTLNVFITLMLLGRFLQERVLERNRRYVLEDDGADDLLVRRLVEQRLETVPAPKVKAGDLLVLAVGDLVPVESLLLDESAHISTDWVTGEASPRRIQRGDAIPAGSFNAGRSACHVKACENFADSKLVALLRQPVLKANASAQHQRLWNGLAKRWGFMVLTVSTFGFWWWLPQGVMSALNVAVSLLVITCPCAIGIAIPLAYELTQSRLRKEGFFVRSHNLLDRLLVVRHVVFDKTGTLTLGRLELVEPSVVQRLDGPTRHILYNLAARSGHPVSMTLARAVEQLDVHYDSQAHIEEVPGCGMEWKRADGLWRLGRADWATRDDHRRVSTLAHNGRAIATLEMQEVLRVDASEQVAELQAQGLEVWLLSGDVTSRVDRLAHSMKLKPEHAWGALSPEQKAAKVRSIGSLDTLYVGDGVNDALAFESALAAGTPAINRPVMPSKSDFFLVGEGLAPIRQALRQAQVLRTVVQRVLGISLAYNVVAIIAALAGLMSPLAAAVSMPLSTLTLLLIAVTSLKGRRSAHLISGALTPASDFGLRASANASTPST
jgi:Cu2+-exporting ATPase